jgi:hypothetical protein
MVLHIFGSGLLMIRFSYERHREPASIWPPCWVSRFLPYNVLALAYKQGKATASIGLLPTSKRAALPINFGTSPNLPR